VTFILGDEFLGFCDQKFI